MAELVDALISGVSGENRASSSLVIRTGSFKKPLNKGFLFFVRQLCDR